MKKYSFIVFGLLMCNMSQPMINESQLPEKYVIGCWEAGFFSSFIAVLNHLLWCTQNNKTPVVYWDHTSFYYSPRWGNGNDNVWEYYFKPVSSLTYEKGDKLHTSYNVHDNYNDCFFYRFLAKDRRLEAYKLISQFVHIKDHIMKKIDTFYHDMIAGKKTIGIHIRGTDKYKEERPVPLEIIAHEANKYQDCQFLVATDEQRILEIMQQLLKGNVINYPSYRSLDGYSLHDKAFRKPPLAQLGEEVLIEVLLLSRCDFFLHTSSSVSAAVLFFNPFIEHQLFTM